MGKERERMGKEKKGKDENVDFGSIRLSVIENVWSFVYPIDF
jgi:hypothetical protein